MRYKFFYGTQPKFSAKDKELFSRGKYRCHTLLQTLRHQPVVISCHTDPDFQIWKVAYGTFCAFFGTYEEALAYCKGRFYDLDGKPLRN